MATQDGEARRDDPDYLTKRVLPGESFRAGEPEPKLRPTRQSLQDGGELRRVNPVQMAATLVEV